MAWTQGEDNTWYLSIEFCQPTPNDDYTEWQLEEGARTVAEWSKGFSFPISVVTLPRHQDTPQGKRSGKSDPGDKFPYFRFFQLCQEFRATLGN